ncbi:rab escort protein 1 [Andrographis paniculata]|uniref:rab escort protein 1 n=1 Tax=Andrographis paniculata TaxID=175694 RepID=UPI0021E99E1B|nr:rab escort protein 1 [Andrographis paniculata]XP_051134561.1 rab escort protein 1 [Andrographis paniculata]
MEESTSYPSIDPSNFDLIVVGTGLPESIVAGAASAAGKTVLHLDPNPFYGTHYSSFPLNDLVSFLQSGSQIVPQSPPFQTSDEYDSNPLLVRSMYSDLEISSYSSEPTDCSRKFNVDLAGPRVFLCSDSMIALILKTGINQYMEFKSVDGNFVSDAEGKLETVPDSRSAIFKSRNLSLPEKNQLMKFFKLVQSHLGNESEDSKISEQDLESPFVDFLTKMGLSQKLKTIILYAIVMANYDQEHFEVCKDVINTRTGINCLALYHSSIGRFSNANGAVIYPIYGQGELPQSFCRRAAVKGCIHVLRMPVVAVLTNKDDGSYKGVKLVSGQELYSSQLILAPSFKIEFSNSYASVANFRDCKKKVARGICIAKNSIKQEAANCLVFFPPKSLYEEQKTCVHVLQLSSNVAACPVGMFVTYLSVICDDPVEGKKSLTTAINALFSGPISSSERNSPDDSSNQAEDKPSLLWSALYIQELNSFSDPLDSISYTTMPDEHLNYDTLLVATEMLFRKIYPNEDFFAMTTNSSEEHQDDDCPEPNS